MSDDDSDPLDEESVVEVPLGDVLDLHGFPPRDVLAVTRDWLDAAHAAGLRELRIIHGRGIGVQREAVRQLLAADSRVLSFADAPGGAGGWGATIVTLR
jgi:dsDNA-specific endonuclease/ATPase MutS2